MRDKIRLVSTAGTGYFYTTDKNKRNMPEKIKKTRACSGFLLPQFLFNTVNCFTDN